jgi:ArsR family transcriptional regulator
MKSKTQTQKGSTAPAAECICPVQVPAKLAKAAADYAAVFRALADETRLRMLGLLAAAKGAELCACEIESTFDLSQPTISHHLKILREAGLVRSERRGPWIYFSLERKGFAAIKELRSVLTI